MFPATTQDPNAPYRLWISDDGIAVAVDGGDIDRIAGQAAEGRHLVPSQCRPGVDQPAALARILLRYQPLDRHFGEMRDRPAPDRGRDRRSAWPAPADATWSGPSKSIRCRSCGSTRLSISSTVKPCVGGGVLKIVDVAVAADKRRAPDRLLPCEVGQREEAAACLAKSAPSRPRPAPRKSPTIPRSAIACSVRARFGVGEPCARPRRAAVGKEQHGGFALRQQFIAHHLDKGRKPRR